MLETLYGENRNLFSSFILCSMDFEFSLDQLIAKIESKAYSSGVFKVDIRSSEHTETLGMGSDRYEAKLDGILVEFGLITCERGSFPIHLFEGDGRWVFNRRTAARVTKILYVTESNALPEERRPATPFQRANAVTIVTSALSHFGEPVCVAWSPAMNAMSVDMVRPFDPTLGYVAFVFLWVVWRKVAAGSADASNSADRLIFWWRRLRGELSFESVGLKAFLGFEVIAMTRDLANHDELYKLVQTLAVEAIEGRVQIPIEGSFVFDISPRYHVEVSSAEDLRLLSFHLKATTRNA